jgi:hypothetical protein
MNKAQQTLRNLQREVQYLATSNNDDSNKTRRIKDLFDTAICSAGSEKSKKCDGCKKLFTCCDLTMWNDITTKELLRKS